MASACPPGVGARRHPPGRRRNSPRLAGMTRAAAARAPCTRRQIASGSKRASEKPACQSDNRRTPRGGASARPRRRGYGRGLPLLNLRGSGVFKPVSVACEPSLWQAPSPRTGKRISGRQRRKAPNHLRAGFLPHRDRERANAPAPNRGKSRVFRGDGENSSCAGLRGGGCSPIGTRLSLQFGEMQGAFAEKQGGAEPARRKAGKYQPFGRKLPTRGAGRL
jgi:hypothetical protein